MIFPCPFHQQGCHHQSLFARSYLPDVRYGKFELGIGPTIHLGNDMAITVMPLERLRKYSGRANSPSHPFYIVWFPKKEVIWYWPILPLVHEVKCLFLMTLSMLSEYNMILKLEALTAEAALLVDRRLSACLVFGFV